MRTLSFLLITFLSASLAFGYTVILKSGKRVEGTRIGEDQTTIQLKDPSGMVLSFRKSTLDLEAMSAANVDSTGPSYSQLRSEPALLVKTVAIQKKAPQKNLVEIARENRANRSGRARSLSLSDLANTPELSIVGSEDPAPSPETPERTGDLSEEGHSWRLTAAALKKEMANLREKKIAAEVACQHARERRSNKRSRSHPQVIDLLPLLEDPAECKRVSEAERRLTEAQTRWDDFEERARRAEVPWQWLE